MTPDPHDRPAFLHVDVDGEWAVRRCYGAPEGDSFRRDACWEMGLPRVRQLLEDEGGPASFFLVGRDLLHGGKRRAARDLEAAGHELGNHTFTHPLDLLGRGPRTIRREIERTNTAFERSSLTAPRGFRGPGYATNRRIRRAASEAGLTYDASRLATWLTYPLRAADAWAAGRWDPRKRQFGRLRDALASRRPQRMEALWELPVTTLGWLGWPLTGSAILALGPERVIRLLDGLRDRSDYPVLVLLHAADLVDWRSEGSPGARKGRVGGFGLSAEEKRRAIRPVVRHIARHWAVRRSDEWVVERMAVRTKRPAFMPGAVRLD